MKSICRVAPLAGSVDRNKYVLNSDSLAQFVAPLAGSVDRNANLSDFATVPQLVAPLAGSVDRNVVPLLELRAASPSLPSRGAWIEILAVLASAGFGYKSLPSRGAWIEIIIQSFRSTYGPVAPLAGSVDRNFAQNDDLAKRQFVAPLAGSVDRNSLARAMRWEQYGSLPSRGAWIEILFPPSGVCAGVCRSPRGERG